MMDPILYQQAVDAAIPQKAELVTVIQIGLIAASVAFSAFRRPGGRKGVAPVDEAETQLFERGSLVPISYGRHWMGALHAVRGRRETRRRNSGNNEFFEQAVQLIALGPMEAFYAISSARETGDGVIIREPTQLGPFYDALEFSVSRGDDFALYPGTPDSPPPPDWVRLRMGDDWTNFAGVSAVHYDSADKGQGGGFWDEREYDCEHMTYPSSALGVPRIIVADNLNGVNPAYFLHEILTLQAPHGAAINESWIYGQGLIEFAETMNNEQIPLAGVFAGELTAGGLIEEMLVNYGMGIVELDGMLWPRTVRAGSTSGSLTLDQMDFPIQTTRSEPDDRATGVRFSFSDHARLSEKSYVPVPVNATSQLNGGVYTGEENIIFANCPSAATKISGLRRAQMLASEQATFNAGRDAERILPMDVIDAGGELFVVNVKRSDAMTGWCRFEGLVDPPLATDTQVLDPGRGVDEQLLEAEPDLLVVVLPTLEGDVPGALILRIRAHAQIDSAVVHVSAGGSPFVPAGNPIPHSSGGVALEGRPPDVERWRPEAQFNDGSAFVIPSESYDGPFEGHFFVQQLGSETSASEPEWPTTTGGEVQETVFRGQGIRWRAFADSSIVIEPLNLDYLELPDLRGDETGHQIGLLRVTVVGSETFVGYAEALISIGEPAWSAGATVAAGSAFTPASGGTGLRYVALNAGTFGATEPELFPDAIGGRVTSGDVVLEARAYRQRVQNVLWGKDGTPRPQESLVGRNVFLGRGDIGYTVRDARIRSGQAVSLKVQPRQGSRAVDLGELPTFTVTPG